LEAIKPCRSRTGFAGRTQINTYAYDALNNRVLMIDNTGTYTTAFDNDNRVVQTVNPAGRIVTYNYDAASRRILMIDPNNGRFTYVYDAADRLTQVTNPQSKTTSRTFDPAGRLTRQVLANGCVVTHGYDAADRKTNVINGGAGGTIINSFTYTYDNADNKLTASEANGDITTWQYDVSNQLIRETRSGAHGFDATHVYDASGNRVLQVDGGTVTTFTFDAANQISSRWQGGVGTTTYGHDAAGNRTIVSAPGGTTYYTWDEENHMVVANPPPGLVTMAYSAEGKRVQKQSWMATTNYLFDFKKVLQETDGMGNLKHEYTSTNEVYGDLLSAYDGSGTSYHQFDALGSTDALLDDSGSLKDAWMYRAYGRPQQTQGTDPNAFTFVGKQSYYFDMELGLYLASVRAMDPATARWVSKDPVPTDPNAYMYCGNNPVNRVDPSGLDFFDLLRKRDPAKGTPPPQGPSEPPTIPAQAAGALPPGFKPQPRPMIRNAVGQLVPAPAPQAGGGGGGAGGAGDLEFPIATEDLVRAGLTDIEIQGVFNWWYSRPKDVQEAQRGQLWAPNQTLKDIKRYLVGEQPGHGVAVRQVAELTDPEGVKRFDEQIRQVQAAREAQEALDEVAKLAALERKRKADAVVRAMTRLARQYRKIESAVYWGARDFLDKMAEAAERERREAEAAQAALEPAPKEPPVVVDTGVERKRYKYRPSPKPYEPRWKLPESFSIPSWLSGLIGPPGPSTAPSRAPERASGPVRRERDPVKQWLDEMSKGLPHADLDSNEVADDVLDFLQDAGRQIESERRWLMKNFGGPIRIAGKYLDWLLIAFPLPRLDRAIREGNYWHLIPGATQLIDAWRQIEFIVNVGSDAQKYADLMERSDPDTARVTGWAMAVTHRLPVTAQGWQAIEVIAGVDTSAENYGRKLDATERIERGMDLAGNIAAMIIGSSGRGGKAGKVATVLEKEAKTAPSISETTVRESMNKRGVTGPESFAEESEVIRAQRRAERTEPQFLTKMVRTVANPVKNMFNRTLKYVEERMPSSWKKSPADRGKGWKWVDENGKERYRYMYPDKNGTKVHEQKGYWRVQNEIGEFLDEDGNVVPDNDPLFNQKTHIIIAQ